MRRTLLLCGLLLTSAPAWADPTFEPVALLRTSLIHTDSAVSTLQLGAKSVVLDTAKADPSPFGFRRGFVLENGQFGFKGTFADSGLYYGVRVEMVPREKDGNRSADYLRDAFAGWRGLDLLDVKLGWQKVAFSQANLKSTQDMALPYAPVFDLLSPQRLLGVTVAGHDPDERVRLTLGAYNSVKQAVEQMRDYDQLLGSARLEVNIDKFLGKDAGFQWRIAANGMYVKQYFDPRAEHRWMGADTRATWRFLQAEAEAVVLDYYTEAGSDGTQKAQRGWGWHADLTGQLWSDVLSLTGRIESMDGDDLVRGTSTQLTIEELSRQKKRWVTVGLGWKPGPQARCVLAYIHRTELEGLSLANDSGQLTCLLAF